MEKNVFANSIDIIDSKISEQSIHWPIDKIAFLDKSILRIAIYEILFTETPHPVIMNEAIEIAKNTVRKIPLNLLMVFLMLFQSRKKQKSKI